MSTLAEYQITIMWPNNIFGLLIASAPQIQTRMHVMHAEEIKVVFLKI